MEYARFVSENLANTFWTCDLYPDIVFGIQLINKPSEPYVNFEYPYQLIFSFYSPGYTYLADSYQDRGGVKIDGTISYMYGSRNGKLTDTNTIVWNGTIGGKKVVWSRVSNIPRPTSDQTDSAAILAQQRGATSWLHDQMQMAYPFTPLYQGL